MKLLRVSRTIGLLALTALASAMAAADDTGWYVGGNLGIARARIDNSAIETGLADEGFSTTSINDKDRHSAYKLFGGYQFTRYFALEGGYYSLGKFGFSATTAPAGSLDGNTRMNGYDLDAVGILPFTEKFSAFGRLGVNRTEVRDSFTGSGLVQVTDESPDKRSNHYKFGVGLQYSFADHLQGRAEVERYRINDAIGNHGDVDVISLGLVYRFGGTGAPQTQAGDGAPSAALAAEPILDVVPVTVQTQQYCSILDIQFDINQDEIQPKEKEKLTVLGTFLNKYPDTTAVIEGHADNVGSAEDNMTLSQRRADSVVSYLVTDLHIAPSRL